MTNENKPLVLLFLGGFGVAGANEGNLVAEYAKKFSSLPEHYPAFVLNYPNKEILFNDCKNIDSFYNVFLSGQTANSEVLNYQENLEAGSIIKNEAFKNLFKIVKKKNSKAHVLLFWENEAQGKKSLEQLDNLAKSKKTTLIIHLVVKSGVVSINSELFTENLILGSLASEKYLDYQLNWQITEGYYNLLTRGLGETIVDTKNQLAKILDKAVCLVDSSGTPLAEINEDDGIVFWSSEAWRFNQLFSAIKQKEFNFFERDKKIINCTNLSLFEINSDDENFIYKKEIKKSLLDLLDDTEKTMLYANADFPARLLDVYDSKKISQINYFNFEEDLVQSIKEIGENIVKTIAEGRKNNLELIAIDFSWLDKINSLSKEEIIEAIKNTDKFIDLLTNDITQNGGCLAITSAGAWLEEYQNLQLDIINQNLTSNKLPLVVICNSYLGINTGEGNIDHDFSLAPEADILDFLPTILGLYSKQVNHELSGRNLLD